MTLMVPVTNAATELDIPAAVLQLPDALLTFLADEARAIILPEIRRLSPDRSGTLDASYSLAVQRGAQGPTFEVTYASYGQYVNFRQPVYVNGQRIETVDALIRAVFAAHEREIYANALRDVGRVLGVDLSDFSLSAELRSFLVRRVGSYIINRIEGALATKIGRTIGREIARELRRQNLAATAAFVARIQKQEQRATAGGHAGVLIGSRLGWEVHEDTVETRREFFDKIALLPRFR